MIQFLNDLGEKELAILLPNDKNYWWNTFSKTVFPKATIYNG